MTDGEGRETIEAGRRRKAGPPQGRAEAPERQRPHADGANGASDSRRLPVRSTGGWLGGCSLAGVLLLVGLYLLLSSGGWDAGSFAPQPGVLPVTATPGLAPVGFTPGSTGKDELTWLVMLYQDADDQVLEQDIFIDLNEAERVGSSEYVHIVAQIDRFSSAFNGDGDWTGARRYYVTRDNDLNRIGSQLVGELGETDMAAGDSLVSFVTWAVANIPADRYVLILSDHGMGWPGGWSDPDPGVEAPNSIPLVSRLGANLYLMELDAALEAARQGGGIEKFDLIGLDACLMAQLEVLAALEPHARYAVASEEVEPSLGWAYTGFLGPLSADPAMSVEDLGGLILDSYIRGDQRLVDPQAFEDYLRGGSVLGGFADRPSGGLEAVIQKLEHNATLSVIDLEALPALVARSNEMAYALQGEDQSLVAQARAYSQSFTSIFGRQVPASYIDLGHFAALLERDARQPQVRQAAAALQVALDQAVVAERHGPGKPGSTGISIYFPNSTLYSSALTGPASYTRVANRFAEESLWDDFLAFHYHDRTFQALDRGTVIPEGGLSLRAPGMGRIAASALVSSPSVARPGAPVRLSADIRGENIGYIYMFAGYLDRAANSILVLDMDYLESVDTRELKGVYYPVWSRDRAFTLAYNWEPVAFAISDGEGATPALFEPLSYGASPEQAVYAVDGRYTFYHTGDTLDARMLFQDGALLAVYGFSGDQAAAAPREIVPQDGDRFTLMEKWIDLDEEGRARDVAFQPGATLTLGEKPLTWTALDAAPGEYLLGFLIEDLDGNTYAVYTQVFVQ